MDDTLYNMMIYGGIALAIMFAIIAVILFFRLQIPAAIGIITGSTARKQIDEIREKGYESVQGMGASKQDAIRPNTSRLSVRDVKESPTGPGNGGSNSPSYSRSGGYNSDDKVTDVLGGSLSESATDVLGNMDSESATDVLNNMDSESATDILSNMDSESATDVLTDIGAAHAPVTQYAKPTPARSADDDIETNVLKVGQVIGHMNGVTLNNSKTSAVKVLKDIIVVHTDECI